MAQKPCCAAPGPAPAEPGEESPGRPAVYPHAILWSPIPFLTWLFPPIGHMGISLSDGTTLDFAGPYFIR